MSSQCEINSLDPTFHSARNQSTTELTCRSMTCDETGHTFTIGDRVQVTDGTERTGVIYRFRRALTIDGADIRIQLNAGPALKFVHLFRLEPVTAPEESE